MDHNNLDYISAEYGQEIPKIKKDDTAIQKALGVLQEDGLFAFVLFIEYKKDKIYDRIQKETTSLLNDIGLNPNKENLRKNIQEITRNIDDMFLAKDLIEKTLVYARYHAKALKDDEK